MKLNTFLSLFVRFYVLNTFIVLVFGYAVFNSNSAYAYYSNDPQGQMFIKRPFADTRNCGPLSAMMLTKFADSSVSFKNINDAIDDARVIVQKQKRKNINYRWWNFRDIKNYLNHNKVSYKEIPTANVAFSQSRSRKIVGALAQGNAVLINIDMNHLPSDSEIGKFYGTTSLFGPWGHFLVIVGYKLVNGELAYIIHDSYSLKGKNRVFYAKNINKAIGKYNKNLLLVKKQDSSSDIFSTFFN